MVTTHGVYTSHLLVVDLTSHCNGIEKNGNFDRRYLIHSQSVCRFIESTREKLLSRVDRF